MKPLNDNSSLMICCNKHIDCEIEKRFTFVHAKWVCQKCGKLAVLIVGEIDPKLAKVIIDGGQG